MRAWVQHLQDSSGGVAWGLNKVWQLCHKLKCQDLDNVPEHCPGQSFQERAGPTRPCQPRAPLPCKICPQQARSLYSCPPDASLGPSLLALTYEIPPSLCFESLKLCTWPQVLSGWFGWSWAPRNNIMKSNKHQNIYDVTTLTSCSCCSAALPDNFSVGFNSVSSSELDLLLLPPLPVLDCDPLEVMKRPDDQWGGCVEGWWLFMTL